MLTKHVEYGGQRPTDAFAKVSKIDISASNNCSKKCFVIDRPLEVSVGGLFTKQNKL